MGAWFDTNISALPMANSVFKPPAEMQEFEAGIVPEFKQSWDKVAMYLSQGIPVVKIAELTGYSPATISALKKKPQVQIRIQQWQQVKIKDYETKHGVTKSLFDDTAQSLLEDIHSGVLSGMEKVALLKILAPKVGVSDAPTQHVHTIDTKALDAINAQNKKAVEDSVIMGEATVVPEPNATVVGTESGSHD